MFIYVRKDLQAEKLNINSSLKSKSPAEVLCIEVKFDRCRGAILGCVHRPPIVPDTQIQTDYNDTEEQIQNVILTFHSKRILTVGDMNSAFATNLPLPLPMNV